MKKQAKNLFRIIFALIFVLSLILASCASEDGPGDRAGGGGEDTPGQGQLDNNIEEEPDDPKARLPFEPTIIDLEGRTFTFADCGWGAETTSEQRDVIAETENGDPINDAVYARNTVIMEMFNCIIAEQKYTGPGELLTAIRRNVTAGDAQFDAAYIRFVENLGPLVLNDCLKDLKQLPNMDLSNPWWDQNCVEKTSINHKLFAVTGDIQILDKGAINAFIFNKQLQAEYQIENLYALVRDGKWTLSKMLEISRQISDDLNGDGMMDKNDRYGLLYYRDSIPAFLAATGEYIARKDENDLPYMSFNSEKVYSALESIYEVIYDENVAFHTMRAFGDAGFIIEGTGMFQGNQSLLMYIRMTEIETLRGMETDFGILPFPKYDEKQENYLSLVNAMIGSALAVPATADPEVSSALLEAMAYEARYTLLPAYYEVTLKTKIARDDESEEILNIIFGNMTYDIGSIFALGGIDNELMYHTMTFGRNMASFYEKNEGRAQRDIDKLIDRILGLE